MSTKIITTSTETKLTDTRFTDTTRSTDSKATKGAITRLLKQRVLIPKLEAAAEYSNDTFWRTKMESAARNRFPHSFYHREGVIYHRYRGKENNFIIPDDPMETAAGFIGFLQKFGNIYSDRDVEYARMSSAISNQTETKRIKTWTNSSKHERYNMIANFARELLIRYDLDEELYGRVYGVLRMGVYLGIYNKKNIQIKDGRISEIEDLDFDEETQLFSISRDALSKKRVELQKKKGKPVRSRATARPVETKKGGVESHPAFLPRRYDVVGEWFKYLDLFESVTKSNYKSDEDEDKTSDDMGDFLIVED